MANGPLISILRRFPSAALEQSQTVFEDYFRGHQYLGLFVAHNTLSGTTSIFNNAQSAGWCGRCAFVCIFDCQLILSSKSEVDFKQYRATCHTLKNHCCGYSSVMLIQFNPNPFFGVFLVFGSLTLASHEAKSKKKNNPLRLLSPMSYGKTQIVVGFFHE